MIAYHSPHQADTAGQKLRGLRQRHGLTLEQMSLALGMSVSVLSRKERGKQPLAREDIRSIIAQFGLSQREAHEFWSAAGLLPDLPDPPASTLHLRATAETLLLNIAFPAYLQTPLGYLVAWNEACEAIWQLSRLPRHHPHMLDLLLQRVEAQAESWERSLYHMLRVFYLHTLHLAGQPQFDRVISHLAEHYGEAFLGRWRSVQRSSMAELDEFDPADALITHAGSHGEVHYLTLRGIFGVPLTYELIVLLPFGDDSQRRYQQQQAASSPHKFYYRPF
jgi:transcriptional regulator with XRE-family HTH domain